MTVEFIIGFFSESIKIAMLMSSPMLLAGLVAGVLVSMFQAATQINETTLSFIPKMVAVALALLFFFPWMVDLFIGYTTRLFLQIPKIIG